MEYRRRRRRATLPPAGAEQGAKRDARAPDGHREATSSTSKFKIEYRTSSPSVGGGDPNSTLFQSRRIASTLRHLFLVR